MNIEPFAKLERASGHKVVYKDGVWWNRIKPFYSWPLQFTARFSPGPSPPLSYRLVGYQHAVPSIEESNALLKLMMIPDISKYDLSRLISSRRNHVRGGLKHVEVRKLGPDDVEKMLVHGLAVNRSALVRQQWAGDHSWYVNERKWKREIEAAHRLGSRECWAAFFDGRIIAWMRAFELENTVHISAAMSHSEYLRKSPNDALLHSFLCDCKVRPGIQSVTFGLECGKPSLNEFKQTFMFEVVPLPIYRWINPIALRVAKSTRFRHYLSETEITGNGTRYQISS